MRRTTLALDEDLFRTLKARAAREGTTLVALVNRLLRVEANAPPRRAHRFRLTTFAGQGVQPGVDLSDRAALHELMGGRW